ncbi:MAG TPA: hypothetical protein VFB84_11640 [Micromonosporaceae bacterium]|nr:hypothetical protein [Micromonosporaceae bacterium]
MTARRSFLGYAVGATGAALLGGCTPRTAQSSGPADAPAAPAELLLVRTLDGLVVLKAGTGQPTLPRPAVIATADAGRVISAEATTTGTRVVAHTPADGRVLAGSLLRGTLTPRVCSIDGRLVALTTPPALAPAGAGAAGRERTTIVVADSSGERVRLDLPGNIEPEAFTTDGRGLFVLDHLPPARPDRYRVRLLDLHEGRLHPLYTRDKVPVPAGAEEEMRGDGRQAVYDPARKMLYTLYTHQPGHQHTRDLLGARPGRPDVHAFVHSLHLEQGWAYCVDLSAPFGESPASGHTLALGRQVYVVSTADRMVTSIAPDSLQVSGVTPYDPPGAGGAAARGSAAMAATADGRIVIGVDDRVSVVPAGGGPPLLSWSVTPPVRGVALAPTGDRVYVGLDGAVAAYELAHGREVARVGVPGLVELRLARPA